MPCTPNYINHGLPIFEPDMLIESGSYDLPEQDEELLSLLTRGEQEIALGKGYDLETVLAEADALLAEEPV